MYSIPEIDYVYLLILKPNTMKDLSSSSDAQFSDCRKYRYALWRIWDEDKPRVMFVGLNPSDANEIENDPTIRRVINFARSWGYGGVYMCNLFAYITPYPKELNNVDDLIKDNDKWLLEVSKQCDKVVFAWGSFDVNGRDEQMKKMFPNAEALIINKNGSPRHPLYVKSDVKLIRFSN